MDHFVDFSYGCGWQQMLECSEDGDLELEIWTISISNPVADYYLI